MTFVENLITNMVVQYILFEIFRSIKYQHGPQGNNDMYLKKCIFEYRQYAWQIGGQFTTLHFFYFHFQKYIRLDLTKAFYIQQLPVLNFTSFCRGVLTSLWFVIYINNDIKKAKGGHGMDWMGLKWKSPNASLLRLITPHDTHLNLLMWRKSTNT